MIGPWPGFEPGQTGWLGPGPAGRLFLRPPTLTAGNFAALWPTDPKFLALKDLNPFKTVSKVQKTSSILRVGFALSKWPHLHRAYVVGGCLFNFGTVPMTYHKAPTTKFRLFWDADSWNFSNIKTINAFRTLWLLPVLAPFFKVSIVKDQRFHSVANSQLVPNDFQLLKALSHLGLVWK